MKEPLSGHIRVESSLKGWGNEEGEDADTKERRVAACSTSAWRIGRARRVEE